MPNFKPQKFGFHILYGKAAQDAARGRPSPPGPRRWLVVVDYLCGALFVVGIVPFGWGVYKAWIEMSLAGACSMFLAHSIWKIMAALGYAGEDEKQDGGELLKTLLYYGMLGVGSAGGLLMMLYKCLFWLYYGFAP